MEEVFTAKITNPEGIDKFLLDMTVYKGKLVQKVKLRGSKLSYKPYFNRVLVTPIMQEAVSFCDSIKGKAVELSVFDRWLPYMFSLGDNEGAYKVSNADEDRKIAFLNAKKVSFIPHECWETGLIWYQLSNAGRYPRDVFEAIKPYLHFHSEQEEEEGNWKGWCFYGSDKLKAIEESLAKVGWSL